MTYPNAQESTMEDELPQPAWLKVLRYLVFGLILASIFAMLTVAWAAFQIVSKSTSIAMPESVSLPAGDSAISITTLSNGDYIVVHANGAKATLFSDNGEIKSEANFQ